jgi:hypothetical protein
VPTRVTGWGDFVDRFGGAVPGHFTAEAVAGFFENGGQAAWIVRADRSTVSEWAARNGDGDDVLRIEATSPGDWSARTTIAVRTDLSAGLARAWTSRVEAVEGPRVTVASTAGLRVGDTVSDIAGDEAVVASIDGAAIVLEAAAGWQPGADLFVRQNADSISLSSATGIEPNEIVRIEEPGQAPRFARVTMLTTQPEGGFVAELAEAASVPGGAFATRTRASDDGLENVHVAVFRESGLNLEQPSLEELAARYAWLPDGFALVLSDGGDAVVVKEGTRFRRSSGSLNATFAQVHVRPSAEPEALVTANAAPRAGDSVQFGAEPETIQTVTPLGGDRFRLGLEATPAIDAESDVSAFQQTRIMPLRFALTVAIDDTEESFEGLALADGHSRYFARDGIVNEVSSLIRVESLLDGGDVDEGSLPEEVVSLSQGTSAMATAQDLIEGFRELERTTEPAILICPDLLTFDEPAVQGSIIGAMTRHAEAFRRFAIVDTPRTTDDQELLDWRLEHVNSMFAAAYAPHVRVLDIDPASSARFRFVPPSGHVAGVFARTDRERGVHKAPANERVRGIVGLDVDYTQRRQDLLNPGAVNLIRSFRGRGRRIWGARNATDDTTWRYVNVRRLFNVIETSVERGTQWVVFEPNTSSTWLRVRVSVENFLNGLWTGGALAGNAPEEAYRVRVGLGETMTEAQVELGLIIVQVAVAPARPAEFVVFQFSHKRLTE